MMSGPEASRMHVHGGAFPAALALRLAHATWRDRFHLAAASHQRPTHVHEVYHAVLVVSGSGSFVAAEGPVAVRAPWLFLVAPGVPHSFQGAPGDDTVYSEVTFTGELGGRLLRGTWDDLLTQRFAGPVRLPAHGPVDAAFAVEYDEEVADLVAAGQAGGPAVSGLVAGHLDRVLFLIWRRLVVEADQDVDAIERARRVLEARLENPPSLEELARIVGLSAKHLGRAFARRFGEPPNRWRIRAALGRAATYLRSSNLSVAEIAERVGFDDHRYFIRRFSRAFGHPPGAFRRLRD